MLMKVIKPCLHSAPGDRPTASEVQAALYAIMQSESWSDDLTAQPACESNQLCNSQVVLP